jgi:hypothetical protein
MESVIEAAVMLLYITELEALGIIVEATSDVELEFVGAANERLVGGITVLDDETMATLLPAILEDVLILKLVLVVEKLPMGKVML